MTEERKAWLVSYTEPRTFTQQMRGEPAFNKLLVIPDHEPGEFVNWYLERWKNGLDVWTMYRHAPSGREEPLELVDIICLPCGISPLDIAGEALERKISMSKLSFEKAKDWHNEKGKQPLLDEEVDFLEDCKSQREIR